MHPLALSAVLATAALAGQAPQAPDREARVLELLRRLPTLHSRIYSTPLVGATNAHGCAIVAPAVGGLCGVGWQPAFDPILARALARDLCAIYDLTPVADVPAPAGVAARLDCLDAAAGIGLKLRGIVEDQLLPAGDSWPRVVDEPAATDLDVAEQQVLAASGVRIHTADAQAFWVAHAGDRLTTTLAYLASVASFLNAATDGDDVDMGALVAGRSMWIPFAAPSKRAGVAITCWSGGCTIATTRAVEIALSIEPRRAFDPTTHATTAPIANAARPTIVQLINASAERGAFTLALRQKGKDGLEHTLATSANEVLFVPGSFAAERPFTLVLALQPGQYRMDTTVWVGAPAAK